MEWYVLIGLLSIVVIICFFYKAHINTKRVELTHIRLPEDMNASRIDSLKVLHISDMHMENISVSPDRLLDILSEERPDLIALTGDYLDKVKSIPKLNAYLKVLRKMNPKYGIYAVFGNHDYVLKHQDFTKLRKNLEDFGCKVLQNENDLLYVDGRQIHIIGIDDFSTKRSDLNQAFRGTDKGFRLVLTHDPNIVLKMEDYAFHYMLAGHFHGGQICWPKPYHLLKMGRLVRMNMVKGLHRYRGKPFYISEGLGQTGINIRVGSRPEITIHHLSLQTMEKEQTPKAV
ncbi:MULTISPECIES: metallophosphoesterase [unclassified Paenibacillus]|uniref:metallophosphoesterase n=1 Tax=unclassified Paenibacillus TaxID=185978 RepID=UPI001AEB410E|nr:MULTISPECIES: metallophosphoesterase [unclassified Paenibacillus]MBP1155386.1 putative MPP superfamily phosphohydrolase [Paenibacillus sp. PvP091]MBP1169229.1 putative MPP superfamily phosphohydrolase [Paenibacillus sp. PvR098]MBP2440257.1 putative MPP superfamily phosphohydrolase [Paenibacillus sp. PvP052]